MPPASWKLGLVMELHPGSDGVARVATLRTANGTHMRRPLIKLCRLPTDKEIIPVESQDFQGGRMSPPRRHISRRYGTDWLTHAYTTYYLFLFKL